MRTSLLFATTLLAALTLTACGKPRVPEVKDPAHPVDASGKPIAAEDFVVLYCQESDDKKISDFKPEEIKTCREVAEVAAREVMNKAFGSIFGGMPLHDRKK